MLRNQLQFRELLDDGNHAPADFLGQHHHLDVLVIFESVADDRRLIVRDGEHCEKLRLRTGFKAKMIRPAEVEDLFDYLALLINFDWVNAAVIRLISVLSDRNIKGLIHLAEAMLENVCKPDQDRQRYATPFESVYQLFQVDRPARFLGWVDQQVAIGGDREVPLTPARNIVKFCCIADGPPISGFTYLGGRSDLGVQLREHSLRWGSELLETGVRLGRVLNHN